jgi:HK97 family phage portal protein
MGIVAQRLQEQRAVSSSIGHPRDSIIAEYYGGYPSSSGVTVSEWTAMNFSAVYRAISIIAGSVSTLPFNLYRTEECDFSDPVLGHPVHQLLNVSPNPEMDAASWREANTGHALSWGNGYSEIELNGAGKPKYAWPIRPDRVTPDRVPSGEVVYRIARPSGGTDTLPASQMIHVHGLSYDGLMGYAVIRLAREAIGMGLATEQFGATFFGNGARPGGILVSPKSLSDVAAENLRRSWNNLHQGPQNANKTAILEEGTSWQQTGLPNEDGMFLQTRAFQIKEIARWFGVPPHLLGDLDRATFSNIEQQSLEFVLYCLRYWFKRWEAACFSKLLNADEQQQYLLQHDADDLIQADGKTRAEADRVDVDSGVKSVNEVRRDRKLPPIGPAGDIYRMPLNMTDATKVADDQLVDPKQAATEAAGAGTGDSAGAETPIDHADPEAAASAADLQGTALNGAQITALLQITEQVANGDLSPNAAKSLIALSFPLMGEAKIASLVDAIEVKEDEPATDNTDTTDGANQSVQPVQSAANPFLKQKAQAVVNDVVKRMIHLEAIAATQAAKKPGEFLAWLDRFYFEHEVRCREALTPAMEIIAAIETRGISAAAMAFDQAKQLADSHREQLLELSGRSHQFHFADDVSRLVLAWEKSDGVQSPAIAA